MNPNRVSCALALCIFVLCLRTHVNAQSTAGSFATFDVHEYDQVNLQTLAIAPKVPIRRKLGAIPFEMELAGNSSLGVQNGTWTVPPTFTAVANDFLVPIAVSQGPGPHWGSLSAALQCPNGTGPTYKYLSWYVLTGNGVQHPLPPSDYVDSLGCLNTSFTDHTLDGMYTVTINSPANVGSLKDRSGNVYTINQLTGSSVTDPNGNTVSWTGVTGNTFNDTLGTTAITMDSGAYDSGNSYSWSDANSGTQSEVINYTMLPLLTSFGCTGIGEYDSHGGMHLVTGIGFPDGSNMSFTYEPTWNQAGSYTGRLASMTLRSGGTITYTYTGGNHGIDCTHHTPPTLTRVTPDGTWTYNLVYNNSGSTTTVTDPQGNQTTYAFSSSGYPVQTKVFQGTTTSGTLLKTVTSCYNGNQVGCATATVNAPITQTDVYTAFGAMTTSSRMTAIYNTYGVPTRVDRYDFGAASPTTSTALTYGSYNAGVCTSLGNIQDRVCTATVSSGGNTIEQIRNTYDSHGNPTSSSKIVGGTTLVSSMTYNANGTIHQSTDVNGGQTTYTYSQCNGMLPTNVAEPQSLSRSMTWNCDGGVLTSVTDENGQTSAFNYTNGSGAEPFWRPLSFVDATGATTTYTYTPTSTESALLFNSNASVVDDLTTLDQLGRPKLLQRRQAPGGNTFDTVQYSYDANGRLLSVRMPCASAQGVGCSTATTTNSYDALSRPTLVSDGGGGTVASSYNPSSAKYDATLTLGPAPAGENTKRRQIEYDGLGRVSSVCEITGASGSGSCGQGVSATGYRTAYTYDTTTVGTNVYSRTTISQNAQGTPQTRVYLYDGIGRLISETNPESGTKQYFYDTAPSTPGVACPGTFNGDLVKTYDANGNTTCNTYDKLHRIMSSSYSGPNAGPNKYFVYDVATVNGIAMQNSEGRMAEAYTAATQAGTKVTDLGFSYDANGRTIDFYESTPHSSGYYDVTASYWANDMLRTLKGVSLPTLTYGPDGEGRPKTVSASTGVNPVSSTSYNPAGQVTDVTFGSSDPVHFAFDPNAGRMTQYKLTINGTATHGDPTWNPNGTLASLAITDPFNASDAQNCTYGYDDLARLASAHCGTIWQQDFTYDPFGNITKSGSISFLPGYNQSTNQYLTSANCAQTGTAPCYDPDGNLLKDGTDHVYTWDSDGHPITVDSETLLYDALGREVEVLKSGAYTEFVFGPAGKLALMNGQSQTKAFVPLPGGTQVKYVGNAISTYRLPDWLGSFRVGSNPNRTYSWGIAFAPFGEMYAQSGAPAWSFTGEEGTADTVSDEYDFLARKLHSAQGRWVSPDPAGLAAVDFTNPQSLNRYAYVANSPMNTIDPLGLADCRSALFCRQMGLGDGGIDNIIACLGDEGCASGGAFGLWGVQTALNPTPLAILQPMNHDWQIDGPPVFWYGNGALLSLIYTPPGTPGAGPAANKVTLSDSSKTPCQAATDSANQAVDNSNPGIGANTVQQGLPSFDWAFLSGGGYWFRGAVTGTATSAAGFLEAAAFGAALKGAYYFGKGAVLQTVNSAKITLAQIKANLACGGSPIPLPDFGSPPELQ